MPADPPRYVPRIAAESTLVRLEEHVEDAVPIVLLLGPTGIGKTLLLQVLQARLGSRHRCVHIPHAAFGPEEVCGWILGLMGEAPGDVPDETLAAVAERIAAGGSRLVLLVDEAASLEPMTAAGLASLARSVYPAVTLVLAGVEDDRMKEVRQALGREIVRVIFDDPMSRSECDRYVAVLLERDTRPEHRGVELGEADLQALCEDSEGNPAALEELLERRMRG